MPHFLHERLAAEAARQGKTGKSADRLIYGTMNNLGAMRGNKETARGRAMQKKHDAKPRGRGRASTNVVRKGR